MKLTDLNPRWASEQGRRGQVVSFDCPRHGAQCRIAVPLSPPLDGGMPIADRLAWQRTGDTFETLTLSPSVDVSGCWHGFVTNGEVSTC